MALLLLFVSLFWAWWNLDQLPELDQVMVWDLSRMAAITNGGRLVVTQDGWRTWQVAGGAAPFARVSAATWSPSGELLAVYHHMDEEERTEARFLRSSNWGKSYQFAGRFPCVGTALVLTLVALTEKTWLAGGKCDQAPMIARTEDEGKTWRKVMTDDDKRDGVRAIAMGSERVGWATGFGNFWRTTDAGKTWQSQPTVGSDHCDFSNDIYAFDEKTAVCVGGWNGLLRTTDGGESWRAIHLSTVSRIFTWRIAGCGPDTAIVVGANGLVLISKDRGQTWEKIDLGTTENVLDVGCAHNIAIFVGNFDGIRMIPVP